MRHALPLLLSLAATVAAQEPPAPLDAPRDRGALRGLTIVVDPLPGDDGATALRGAHYLARLLERSGAGVAMVRSGHANEPIEPASSLAESAGAHLVVLVSGANGEGPPVAVAERRAPPRIAALESALAEQLASRFKAFAKQSLPVETTRPIVCLYPLRVDARDDTAGPRRHRPAIHALFDSIVAWSGEQRARLEALPAAAERRPDPDAAPSGQAYWPVDRSPETEAEVAGLIDGWRRGHVVDRTMVWLDVQVRKKSDGWELSGSTELPALENAVRRLLDRHGVKPVRGELRRLPAEELGDAPFGLTTDAAAITWARPGAATGLRAVDGRGQVEQTELLPNEPVRLLDREKGHFLVHALSGYLGWLPEDAIRRCTAEEHAAAVDRATGAIGKGSLVAEHASAQLGIPYVFGGRSATGLDCSGLCQTAWSEQGVFLPRDAGMQILAGALVSTHTRPAPLRPGDLVFFHDSGGRISHVALSLGGSRYVHATPPQVTFGSLDPEDPWYDGLAERFVLAKRPGW